MLDQTTTRLDNLQSPEPSDPAIARDDGFDSLFEPLETLEDILSDWMLQTR
ncbi:MAG: hypothetical protein ACK5NY_03725 [Burkholderiaceae bacterium]|jgi:hypothetical protein